MLDLDWERSVPILNIDIAELQKIFAEYNNTLIVTDFKAIQIGCKNSNFMIGTNNGRFLLRMADKNNFNNEEIAFELLKDKINIPNLLFHTTNDKVNIFIYQYINGHSLQERMIEGNQCEYSWLEQVAKAAAIIHNTPKENTSKLAKLNVPPIEMWYETFLSNPTVKQRIGNELYKRIRQFIVDKQEFISIIDRYRSFVHSDFRPANMLVDKYNQIYFVDWESAWWGYTLVDIGQFFRYIKFFNDTHINLFQQTYNTFANKNIPDNWFDLSVFIDLVNPLQLLSINQETPIRNADLINIIEEKLAYFDY